MSDAIIAIVPAAGQGARAHRPGDDLLARPKQYRVLAGQPMLRHTVMALLLDPRIVQIRVAVAPQDRWVEQALAGLPRTVWRPCGGATRADTVASALADSGAHDGDWILVHDCARPGLGANILARLIDTCVVDAVGGLLALPVTDTVKLGAQRVARTLERNELWLAQTPQMFRAGVLRHALAAAATRGIVVTDEACAMEAAGFTPLLVPGTMHNFKVTWPEDFELMEKCL